MLNKIRKTPNEEFILNKCELEHLLEQASKQGAKMALAELGLHDENASKDINDLRELLKALRMAKKDSFRIFIKWIMVAICTLITAGFISLLGHNINLK
jgi:hypothetical protein